MEPGDILAGRFEIERLAGSKGTGHVYRAHDLRTGAPVALKLQQQGLSPEHLTRFESEAQVLAELRHPHIVQYLTQGATQSGERYLVMEWLEGENLKDRLFRARLTVAESITLGVRVAEALGAIHARGIMHRDLKPDHLFLPGGAVHEVKLLDFDIARLPHLTHLTRTRTILRTLGYMAPEQARGEQAVTAGADVFALGAILFECLTGTPAFAGHRPMEVLAKIVFAEAPPVSRIVAGVPPLLDALVARMLAKDPSARPADGMAVATELTALEETEELHGDAEGPRRTSLTRGEQRLFCVVLVAGELPAEVAGMATATPGEMASLRDALLPVAEPYGARLEVLADGSAAATLVGTAVATDQAAQGARCALALRAHLPDRPMALAMGRGEIDGRLPVGEAIARAASMLRASGARPEDSRLIAVDEVAAGLLDARFEITVREGGRALSGVREGALGVRTLLGKVTPCVGRERELATLEALFAECCSGSMARPVLVTADAGAGKSRLRHEFLRRVRSKAVQIWSAHGDPMRAGAPFELLGQVVRRTARLQAGEPIEARRAKLAARIAQHVDGSMRARVTEFLGEMAGTPFPDDDSVQLYAARQNAILMGDQIRRAWADFIEAECRVQPVLLVLEDLHWGDLPTVEHVGTALRLLRKKPLMVLAFARPDVHKRFPSLWAAHSVQELRLGALPSKACEKLSRLVLDASVTAETVAKIVERSQGNAFFLEELVRAVAEGREEDTPGTVLAMVQSRFEALAPQERRVLRAGSVFGRKFWRGAASALLDRKSRAGALDQVLAKLEEREWITSRRGAKFQGEREYLFRHELVREAAYGMLTGEDRVLGHRLAGEWLEQVGETEAQVIAEHFEQGNEPERAIRWYRRAAEQALEGNDLRAAIDRVERALACGASGEEKGELLRIRADAHSWLGEFVQSERWGLEAMELLPQGSPRWYAAEGAAAWAVGALGHTERLLELVSKVEESWSEQDVTGLQMVAATWTASWLLMHGQQDTARALYARVEALADRFRDEPAVNAVIASGRAAVMAFAASTDDRRESYEIVIQWFERAGDQRNACFERCNLANVLSWLGAHAEASRSLRGVLADADRMGLRVVTTTAKQNLGFALTHLGALDEARALLLEAIESSAEEGDLRMLGYSRAYLASILRLTGDLAQAETEARRAVEELVEIKPSQTFALATLAEVLLARGSLPEALSAARQAAELLESLGQIAEGEALVRLVYAEALEASGEMAAAHAAIIAARERLLARADRITDPTYRESFLQRVPENARTLERARQWVG
jgi:eukaryotic-like serine/threonine-protein kinase